MAHLKAIRIQSGRIRKELLAEVEKEARKIMKQHPNLVEFIMAMGTCFFVDKNGNNISLTTEVYKNYSYSWKYTFKYFTKLHKIFDEFDEIYKLSGEPMRFTATSKITKDW